MAAPRSGWRGAMMVHRSGTVRRSWRCASATMASSPSCVLAAISSGRPSSAGCRRSSSAMFDRRRRRVDLEIAGREGAGGAQSVLKRRAKRIVLRQHQGEAAEQRPRHAEAAPPALERALGHARVDERQRNAARRAFQDQVRPDLRLGEDRQVRPPVVEEAAHELRAHRAAHTDAWRADPGARRPASPRSPCRS